MKKQIINLSILTILALFILAGCGSSVEPAEEPEYTSTITYSAEEPEYASPIVDSALKSMSNGDYTTHVKLFTEETQGQLTEATFQQAHQLITGKIGTYVNKSFEKVQQEGIYEVVYYQAQFTDEPADVTVRAIFQDENGETKLAGFWLDSPKLRR